MVVGAAFGRGLVRILVPWRRCGSCCGCSASDCEPVGLDGADGWLPGRWLSGVEGVVVDQRAGRRSCGVGSRASASAEPQQARIPAQRASSAAEKKALTPELGDSVCDHRPASIRRPANSTCCLLLSGCPESRPRQRLSQRAVRTAQLTPRDPIATADTGRIEPPAGSPDPCHGRGTALLTAIRSTRRTRPFRAIVLSATPADYRTGGSLLPALTCLRVLIRRATARAAEAVSGEGSRCPWMSAGELVDFLGVSLNTVYIWNHRHRGPRAHNVGRYLRYRWP